MTQTQDLINSFIEKVGLILTEKNISQEKDKIIEGLLGALFANIFYKISQDKDLMDTVPLDNKNIQEDELMNILGNIPEEKREQIVSDAINLTLEDFVANLEPTLSAEKSEGLKKIVNE